MKYLVNDILVNEYSGEMFMITHNDNEYYHFVYLIPCNNKAIDIPFAFMTNVVDYALGSFIDGNEKIRVVNF